MNTKCITNKISIGQNRHLVFKLSFKHILVFWNFFLFDWFSRVISTQSINLFYVEIFSYVMYYAILITSTRINK